MRTAAQVLRDAILAWQREEARERVARWRADPDADAPLDVLKRHAWLWTPSAQEAIADAVGERQISIESQMAIHAQLAEALRRRAWLEMTAGRLHNSVLLRGRALSLPQAWADLVGTEDRRERAAIATALAHQAADHAGRIQEARAFAAERARRFPLAPNDAQRDELCVQRAAQFLKDTADAAREHVRHLTRGLLRGEAPAWHDVGFALRAHSLDGLMPQVSRMRRIAEPFGKLGFDREINAHIRVEPMTTGAIPRARLAVIDVPTDIRIGIPAADWGPFSELSAWGALARALAYTLGSRELPIERRRSVHGSVPRVFATLCAQWMTDPAFLKRVYGWSAREVEVVARLSAVMVLLNARRSATLVCLDAAGFSDRDRCDEMTRAAWACETPFALFAGWLPDSERLREQWRGQVVGLAAAQAMRERFDHDWYRNPRVAEPLRGAAARAGELSAETWLDELGAPIESAAVHMNERLG